ncbi:DUF4136 domain-containing protein [Luminiphilus syltensis]|uniref:DUF4136 domain-containing protein n=1 Tax=Luminiphilus syltensis TaxID=1341119 RepID=UPI00031EDA48|nr:DUF4136 domain-containing protein [Luminiphilus syltensis]
MTSALRFFTLIVVGFIVTACNSVQVERANNQEFSAAGYQTYGWKFKAIENTYGSDDPFYVVGPQLQRSVDAVMADKGYRLVKENPDFIINFDFQSSMADGKLTTGTSNIDPAPQAVINRGADQATVDNSYALSQARELNTLNLLFEDGKNLHTVWSASMSQIVENVNHRNVEKIRNTLDSAVQRTLRLLPDAPK